MDCLCQDSGNLCSLLGVSGIRVRVRLVDAVRRRRDEGRVVAPEIPGSVMVGRPSPEPNRAAYILDYPVARSELVENLNRCEPESKVGMVNLGMFELGVFVAWWTRPGKIDVAIVSANRKRWVIISEV